MIGEFSMISPIFDCSIVKGVKIDEAFRRGLFNSVNIILFKKFQNVLSDFPIVEISVHLRVFCFNKNTT